MYEVGLHVSIPTHGGVVEPGCGLGEFPHTTYRLAYHFTHLLLSSGNG